MRRSAVLSDFIAKIAPHKHTFFEVFDGLVGEEFDRSIAEMIEHLEVQEVIKHSSESFDVMFRNLWNRLNEDGTIARALAEARSLTKEDPWEEEFLRIAKMHYYGRAICLYGFLRPVLSGKMVVEMECGS